MSAPPSPAPITQADPIATIESGWTTQPVVCDPRLVRHTELAVHAVTILTAILDAHVVLSDTSPARGNTAIAVLRNMYNGFEQFDLTHFDGIRDLRDKIGTMLRTYSCPTHGTFFDCAAAVAIANAAVTSRPPGERAAEGRKFEIAIRHLSHHYDTASTARFMRAKLRKIILKVRAYCRELPTTKT